MNQIDRALTEVATTLKESDRKSLVASGLLSFFFGPVGWLWTVVSTGLPLRTMWTNVFNDLIWLPFFIAYFVWYRRQGGALFATTRG